MCGSIHYFGVLNNWEIMFPFSIKCIIMHDITKHELPLAMYYDISNYIMNPKECVNTVMCVFSLSCRSHTESMQKKILTSVQQWTW